MGKFHLKIAKKRHIGGFFVLVHAIVMAPVFAQSPSDTLVDQITVQFDRQPTLPKPTGGYSLTGMHLIDSLNAVFECTSAKRLFSEKEFPLLDKNSGLARIYSLKFTRKLSARLLIAAYLKTDLVTHAETEKIGTCQAGQAVVPNDQYFSRQWAFANDGTLTYQGVVIAKRGADMKITEAWDIQKGDSTVIVAILDSGCRLTHEEFKGRIWQNTKEIPGNGVDDDANGFIDDVQGWNFVDTNNVPEDDYFHGTSVASQIAANPNNGIGYAGVDWKCKIMVVKVSDSLGKTRSENLAKGILYAAENGAKIINISIAYQDTSPKVNLAIDYAYSKGITICCAAGNDNKEGIAFPASNKKTIAVGATDPDDTRTILFIGTVAGGSNFGPEIDCVAPGNYIPGLAISPQDYNSRGGGTSASTAFVSGLVALLLAQNNTLTPAQVHDIICTTADDQVGKPAEDTKGWDKYYGYGRVNALKALEYVVNSGTRNSFAGKIRTPALAIKKTPDGTIRIVGDTRHELTSAIIRVYNLKGVDVTNGYVKKELSRFDIALTPKNAVAGIAILTVRTKTANIKQEVAVMR
jgi:thermitase